MAEWGMTYAWCLSVLFYSHYKYSMQTCFQTTSEQCVNFSGRLRGQFGLGVVLLDTA